jgi:hypothetical protein
MIKFANVISIGVLLVGVLVAVNWSTLSRFKIETDLRQYGRAVRQSKLMLDDKERLLNVIERLEDRLRLGEQINFRLWCRHHQTISEMVDDGIDGDEARLIERELFRTEQDFTEPEQ